MSQKENNNKQSCSWCCRALAGMIILQSCLLTWSNQGDNLRQMKHLCLHLLCSPALYPQADSAESLRTGYSSLWLPSAEIPLGTVAFLPSQPWLRATSAFMSNGLLHLPQTPPAHLRAHTLLAGRFQPALPSSSRRNNWLLTEQLRKTMRFGQPWMMGLAEGYQDLS